MAKRVRSVRLEDGLVERAQVVLGGSVTQAIERALEAALGESSDGPLVERRLAGSGSPDGPASEVAGSTPVRPASPRASVGRVAAEVEAATGKPVLRGSQVGPRVPDRLALERMRRLGR